MKDQARIIIEKTAKSLCVADPASRRGAGSSHSVQSLWRRHGWVPPTEMGKNFRASLKTTVDRMALPY